MQHTSVTYSWNYLDELICGYTDDLFDSLKFNCIKMVLAPVASLNEERLMVSAFTRFKEWLVAKKPYQLTTPTIDVQIVRRLCCVCARACMRTSEVVE